MENKYKFELLVYNLIDKYFKDKKDKGGKPYKYHLYNINILVILNLQLVWELF